MLCSGSEALCPSGFAFDLDPAIDLAWLVLL